MTDYTKLVKALRYTAESISRGQLEVLRANVLSDAAAAIEELQAEIRESMQKCAECGDRMVEPKQGEWELIDEAEPMRWGCSRCKYLSWETSSYCPRCGAKMEVQE